MYCGNCGYKMADSAKFCPNCGAPVRKVGGYGSGSGYQGSGQQRGYILNDNRSLLTYILLTIVTCGIYAYYFVYTLARDMNIACENDGEETPGLLMYILLSIITCGFYNLYWDYKIANRLAKNAPRYGLYFSETGTTVLMWYLIGLLVCGLGQFVAMHFIIQNSNALFREYNRRWNPYQ